MASRAAVFVVVFAVLISCVAAHNITDILSRYPEFASFNQILSQTKVADEINRRHTITVLAVDNSELDAVSGRPLDQVENIIRVHVVLDYYDVTKLTKLSKKTTLLTTLFQATGHAIGQAGFLNATDLEEGKVAFGSAVAGAGLDVYLVKSVAALPYNISVLQVSGLIVPSNIDHLPPPSPATPPPSPVPATASAPPKKSPAATVPAAAPAKHATGVALVPAAGGSNDGDVSGASPSDAPTSSAVTPAGSTADIAPAAADGPAPDTAKKHKSSASHVAVGSTFAIAIGVALFGAF